MCIGASVMGYGLCPRGGFLGQRSGRVLGSAIGVAEGGGVRSARAVEGVGALVGRQTRQTVRTGRARCAWGLREAWRGFRGAPNCRGRQRGGKIGTVPASWIAVSCE